MQQCFSITLHLDEEQSENLIAHHRNLVRCFEQGLPIQQKLYTNLVSNLREILFMQKDFSSIYEYAQKHFINLELYHSDNRICSLPWHIAFEDCPLLYIAQNLDQFRALSRYIPFIPLPLKILIMVSAPEDLTDIGLLQFEEEEELIIKSLSSLIAAGKVLIDYTDDGSLESLMAKLNHQHYHVLHFSGHGFYDDKKESGCLLLEDPLSMDSETVEAKELGKILNSVKYIPPLWVLSACQSGNGRYIEEFRGITTELLEIGIPAVIGMQYSILDDYASYFAAEFYRSLSVQESVMTAYRTGIDAMKQKEEQEIILGRLPQAQWVVPKLFLSKEVHQIIDWNQPIQKLLGDRIELANGFASPELLQLRSGSSGNYRFIGRRRERKKALRELNHNKAILIKGMGGVGKTALAENLVAKLTLADPQTKLFFLNEKAEFRTLDALFEQILQVVENNTLRARLVLDDIPSERKLWLLISALFAEKNIRPIFVFDNLETFQESPGAPFLELFSDILQVIEYLLQKAQCPVILTCRYPLAEFPQINTINLNQVSYSDIFKKCLTLSLAHLSQQLAMSPQVFAYTDSITGLVRQVQFNEIIECLHRTIGGNYRVLELFDAIYSTNQGAMLMSLRNLEDFERKLEDTFKETIIEKLSIHTHKLIFAELYNLLSLKERIVVQILKGFRIPISISGLQSPKPISERVIKRLVDLTLVEESIYNDGSMTEKQYYLPAILRGGLLGHKKYINHRKAGAYFEDTFQSLVKKNYSFLEESFWHFLQDPDSKKEVESLAKTLCNHFFLQNQFRKSLYIGKTAEDMIGPELHGEIFAHIGLIYHLYGNYDKAKRYQEQGLKYMLKIEDKEEIATIQSNLSATLVELGDVDEAMEQMKKSLAIQKEIQDMEGVGTTYANIGVLYEQMGDLDKALSLLEKALTIQKGIGDRAGEGVTEGNLGLIYKRLENYDEALDYFFRSLEIHQETNQRESEANVLNNIGLIYDLRGDYPQALAYMEKSLKIKQQLGDFPGIGTSLNNIGQIYHDLGKLEDALKFTKQALKIAIEIGNKEEEGETRLNIGAIYLEMGDFNTSIEYLTQSLKIARTQKNLLNEGIVANNLGELYHAMEEVEKAEEYYFLSFEIASRIEDKEGQRKALDNLAVLFYESGEFVAAEKIWNESLTHYLYTGDLQGQSVVLGNIGMIYFSKEEFEMALDYYNKSLKINHKIGNVNEIELRQNNMKLAFDRMKNKIPEKQYQEIMNKYKHDL